MYESRGVQAVFLNQQNAIDYATGRASFRCGEIRGLDCDGAVQRNFGIDLWFMSDTLQDLLAFKSILG